MIILAAEGCFWPLTASMISEVKNKYAYVITQDIYNTFIEVFFLWDVWFLGQSVYFKIEHPLIINKNTNSSLAKGETIPNEPERRRGFAQNTNERIRLFSSYIVGT